MKTPRAWRSVLASIIATVLVVFGLYLIGREVAPIGVSAATPRYVATDGVDAGTCDSPVARCLTVQYAVDQSASGDSVLVAGGVYTGVQTRAGLVQSLYLSRSLAIRGGYTTADGFAMADSGANPTTLSAVDLGRVLVITSGAQVGIEGLRLISGSVEAAGAEALGGGGALVVNAQSTFSGSVFQANRASIGPAGPVSPSVGGGIAVAGGVVTATGSTFEGNQAVGRAGASPDLAQAARGGAIHVHDGLLLLHSSVLSGNVVQGGSAAPFAGSDGGSGGGGGVSIAGGFVQIMSTSVLNNLVLGGNGADGINPGTPGTYPGGNGGTASGGAVLQSGGSLAVAASVILANRVQGGSGASGAEGVGTGQLAGGNGGSGGVGRGGGVRSQSNLTLTSNVISRNVASGGTGGVGGNGVADSSGNGRPTGNGGNGGAGGGAFGGGVDVESEFVTMIGGMIVSNTVSAATGGAGGSAGVPIPPDVDAGSPGQPGGSGLGAGGGIAAATSGPAPVASIEGIVLRGNQALTGTGTSAGGAIHLGSGAVFALRNLAVLENLAGHGSGVWSAGRTVIAHLTLARNPGEGIAFGGAAPTATVTNLIVAEHTTGISAAATSDVVLTGVLWFNNGQDTGGAGPILIGGALTGNPRFAPDGYHLQALSFAINNGVSGPTTTDIDGQLRPQGGAPDLGADEAVAITGLTLTGPTVGLAEQPYIFAAAVSPTSSLLPITYTWQASGQSGVIHPSKGLTDSLTLTWTIFGTQVVTVAAQNIGPAHIATTTIVIATPTPTQTPTATPTGTATPIASVTRTATPGTMPGTVSPTSVAGKQVYLPVASDGHAGGW